MKKILSVFAIVGVLMVATIGASVASETGGGDNANQPAVKVITGENDQRIFTPELNNRERYAIQKALKKRALAQRNQILLNAAQQDAVKTDASSSAE